MKSYPITIDGKTISIKSDGDEEQVQALVAELQTRYELMSRGGRNPPSNQELRVMTMVAMVLLSELSALRTRHERMGHQALTFARELSVRIDEALAKGPE